MTEEDLFTLFRPSGSSQGPKLREAMRSLRLVEALGGQQVAGVIIKDGCVVKQNNSKQAFFNAIDQHREAVNQPTCNFDVLKLSSQVDNECVWTSSKQNDAAWGGLNEQERGCCAALITRIETIINATELHCVFRSEAISLDCILANFAQDADSNLIRVSMEHLAFQHHAREIIANAVGRCLLSMGREGYCRDQPTVVILEEAHQFLNRTLGDELNTTSLDAFGLIAKEGRKYGLTCILSTQRPGDIPSDVLSQLGTLIVHRLVNERDRLV